MCKWCQQGLAIVGAWLWELFRVSFWRQISDHDSCFLVVHCQLQWLHLLPFDVYKTDPFRFNFSTQTVQITQNVSVVFWPGIVTPDMERSSPLSILGVTQTLAQLSVHMFPSVPDLTAPGGNPVNVTACPVKPLFCQRLLLSSSLWTKTNNSPVIYDHLLTHAWHE